MNRSGYYKWLKHEDSQYEKDRKILTDLLFEAHRKYPSYGYHRLAAMVRKDTGWIFSDNLVHKCCKFAGIRSKAKHYKKPNKGMESKIFPNRVQGRWNAQKPMELLVSDMTCIIYKNKRYEWTYVLDTFNNEILSHHLSDKEGDKRTYYECLSDVLEISKSLQHPIVLHTDQGAVYSSKAFAYAHKGSNIIRSMSRIGTPTDNAVIESVNGWIKEELKVDFDYKNSENLEELLKEYVKYFNEERPAYALNYQTPKQYKIAKGFG